MSTAGRVREKANRLPAATSRARSRRSSEELGSVRLPSVEPPIWRTARSLVASFVAEDRFERVMVEFYSLISFRELLNFR